jgi:hypothetical protein
MWDTLVDSVMWLGRMCTRNVRGEFRGEIRLGCNGCNATYDGRYGCNTAECMHEEAHKRTRAPTGLG